MACEYCKAEDNKHDEACPEIPVDEAGKQELLRVWLKGKMDGKCGSSFASGWGKTYTLGYRNGERERKQMGADVASKPVGENKGKGG